MPNRFWKLNGSRARLLNKMLDGSKLFRDTRRNRGWRLLTNTGLEIVDAGMVRRLEGNFIELVKVTDRYTVGALLKDL